LFSNLALIRDKDKACKTATAWVELSSILGHPSNTSYCSRHALLKTTQPRLFSQHFTSKPLFFYGYCVKMSDKFKSILFLGHSHEIK